MLSNQTRTWMYERMIRSRYFEEALQGAYFEEKLPAFNMAKGPLPGEIHFSAGQEPVAAGVCAALGPEDIVTTAHRPHHVAVARDVNFPKLCAELFQKGTGLSEGRGGHMHLYDKAVNFSCSSIVGESMGATAGMALALKMQKRPGVAVTVIGEGAVNQGVWHEAMNIAALWKLPFICVIEDNYYGVTVSKAESTAIPRNSDRAAAYGVPGTYVEDNDADAVYDAMVTAVERAKAGEGPSVIEVQTARLWGHYAGDMNAYVPDDIKAQYFQDALPAYRARLIELGAASEEDLTSLEAEVRAQVADGIAAARAADYAPPEAALEKLYANPIH